MLNLTEQAGSADSPDAREERLERASRTYLPPCLIKDRRPLEPTRTIGWADAAEPGSTCLQGCQFELCPYPPSGAQPRAELSEAFCRRQQTLLGRRASPASPHDGVVAGHDPGELESFWTQMAGRTRTPRPED